MKHTVHFLISIFFILLLAVGMQCSLGPDYAGGAGAGNPATLSLIANGLDTTLSSLVKNTVNFRGISDNGTRSTPIILPIEDSSCMIIDVQGLFLVAQYAAFPVPPGTVIPDEVYPPLVYDPDSNEIVLPGPFLFDVLRGTTFPRTGFMLPNGIYRHVDLLVANDSGQDSVTGFPMMNGYQIIINGSFTYDDTLRAINIYILSNQRPSFHTMGDGLSLFDEDSVELIIGLDERQWLDSIGIRGCIKKGEVFLDNNGAFTIVDSPSNQGPAAHLCERIRNNIFRSGIFRKR